MKGHKAALILCLGLSGWLAAVNQSTAQVYPHNIVGFINLGIHPGDNLVANQLISGNDTLTNLFQNGIPDGSTFTKWDSATSQYLPVSTYDSSSGWDINYGLSLGEGGLFHTPTLFTNTFAGSVWPGFDGIDPFVPPLVTSSGTLLLSCLVPIGSATFYDVVGRNPLNGESVTMLDPLSQVYTTTTFQNGTWDNSAPSLNVGQAALFNLEAVPEPSVIAMFGSGAALLLIAGRKRTN